MGHDHDHGAALARAGSRHKKRLFAAFCLIGGFFFVEAAVGWWSNSLALLSDAGHMLTDVLGLGMALAAIQLADRHAAATARATDPGARPAGGRPTSHTYGLYRLEILAAFINALLLFGVAIFVLIEAIRRIGTEPEVLSTPMLVVATLGLVVNIVAYFLLRPGADESLNVEGAQLEVLADLVGSVGAIIAALLLKATGWAWVDPVMGAAIGVWILPRTWRLGHQAVRILLQAAPPDLDLDRLHDDLEAVPDVIDVHDVHVWTLTSGMEAASAHLMTRKDADHHQVLDQAREVLSDRYGIDHATLQVEPEDHEGCHEMEW